MTFQLRLERRTVGSEALDRTRKAETDILRTMSVYCHAMDYNEPEVWASCFTEDGTYRARFPSGDTREIVGREALAAYARAHEGPPKRYPKHMSWAPVLDIDGDSAVGTGMFVIFDQGPTGPIVQVYGRYDDELQRVAEGLWCFKSRTSNVEVVAESFRPATAASR